MGPMGGMGGMMSGWNSVSGPAPGWPGALPLLLVLLMLGCAGALLATGVWRSGLGAGNGQAHSPEETLRLRYASGEFTAPQYREALVEILKDRYVRDELALDEYEARLALLLGLKGPREAQDHRLAPPEFEHSDAWNITRG